MQQHERAALRIERALRDHPRDPALMERLATLYILTHSRDEAEALCREWLRDQPEASTPLWLLGRVALGNHQVDTAIRQFEAALAREPDSAEYCQALGGALARKSESAARERSLALLRRAAALRPDQALYRYRLGAALQERGQWEEARRELLATLALDPANGPACNGLTQLAQGLVRPHQVALWAGVMRHLQDRRREEKARRREAGARPGDPAAFLALARTLLRGGQPEKAAGQLDQALRLRPGWAPARRLRARVAALRAVL
jgi:tetratricopeptide (TPR) repeat protein